MYNNNPYNDRQFYRRQKDNSALTPILENEDAQAVHLKQIMMPRSVDRNKITSSRRSIATVISDPDNGILFLDNEDRIRNPVNMKTPPPPMWGDVIEEDYYDET